MALVAARHRTGHGHRCGWTNVPGTSPLQDGQDAKFGGSRGGRPRYSCATFMASSNEPASKLLLNLSSGPLVARCLS